jgi:hypothetical protein
MKAQIVFLMFLILLLPSCSSISDPISVKTDGRAISETRSNAGYIPWAACDFVIARDGSEWEVSPNRMASATWGYHLNAVKLLEVSPGRNCIGIEKIELLDNGDLAVDISITHPYHDPCYTGFDVRGIIMFPSSQLVSDIDLYEQKYGKPPRHWAWRWASYRKGNAELMNPDGYTTLWAPYYGYDYFPENEYELEEGFPIFDYYEGWMASGEDLGTINGFKHYYSNETRHMFEVNEQVTRTFVIRPPAEGPIKASYSVYAHWVEPSVLPVTDPATQFPPEANSPLPYEFWIEQLFPIDCDAPENERAGCILWHIKSWNFGVDEWDPGATDLLRSSVSLYKLMEVFAQCPDCYRQELFSTTYFTMPEILPGVWPIIFTLSIDHDNKKYTNPIATDYYISYLEFGACDGEW